METKEQINWERACYNIVVVAFIMFLLFTVRTENNIQAIASDYEIPEDVKVYEEKLNSTLYEYYDDVECQLEFYENMADAYYRIERPNAADVTYHVILGEWYDENIKKAIIMSHDNLSFSYNTKYIELETEGNYSYEEFKSIVEIVLIKNI